MSGLFVDSRRVLDVVTLLNAHDVPGYLHHEFETAYWAISEELVERYAQGFFPDTPMQLTLTLTQRVTPAPDGEHTPTPEGEPQ